MVTRNGSAVTLRDLEVLRWLGEQYAAPLSTVAELVGAEATEASADRLARRTAERLELGGYAARRSLQGGTWITPTRAGLRAVGLDYRAEVPAETLLVHVAAVGRLRLHLAADMVSEAVAARWESERAIRARLAGRPTRRCDGGLYWPDGTAVGVELERTIKDPARYVGIVTATDSAWTAGVWWFTPANLGPLLTARLAEAGGGDRHQVYPLPPEVAP